VPESHDVPDDGVDGVTRAVGIKFQEHVAERGEAEYSLFDRARVALRRLRKPLRDGAVRRWLAASPR
jgi:hypothetical protein